MSYLQQGSNFCSVSQNSCSDYVPNVHRGKGTLPPPLFSFPPTSICENSLFYNLFLPPPSLLRTCNDDRCRPILPPQRAGERAPVTAKFPGQ